MACEFSELLPGGQDCSGNGVCLSNVSLCKCEPGWSGIGDFTLESQDCDQYDIVIRILWGLCLSVWSVVLCQCAFYFNVIIRMSKKAHKNTINYLVGISISCLLMMSVSIMKVASPADNYPVIGGDIAITVLFSAGAFVWWTMGLEFIARLARLFTTQAKRLGSEITVIPLPRILIQLNLLAFALTPCLCLFDKDNCTTYGRLHYVTILPSIIGLGLYWNHKFAGKLIKDLEAVKGMHVDNQDTESKIDPYDMLLTKMKTFSKVLRDNGYTNLIIAILMSSWTFLLRKASYQLPIAWISAGMISLVVVRVICNNEEVSYKNNTGSSKRWGRTKSKTSSKTILESNIETAGVTKDVGTNHYIMSTSVVVDDKHYNSKSESEI